MGNFRNPNLSEISVSPIFGLIFPVFSQWGFVFSYLSHVLCVIFTIFGWVCLFCVSMGWLHAVGSLKLQVSLQNIVSFIGLFLQKSPIILRSLLIVATPYSCSLCLTAFHIWRDIFRISYFSSCFLCHSHHARVDFVFPWIILFHVWYCRAYVLCRLLLLLFIFHVSSDIAFHISCVIWYCFSYFMCHHLLLYSYVMCPLLLHFIFMCHLLLLLFIFRVSSFAIVFICHVSSAIAFHIWYAILSK